ncbi:MAG: hypothetical protein ACR2O6_05180, partial [Ilumatobacteraceae bacterium]
MSSSTGDAPPRNGDRPRSDEPPHIERLAALALFGPLDLTIKVVEELPSSVEKARQQLVAARFLGKMVVDQSLVQARRRLGITTVPAPSPATVDRPERQEDAAPAPDDDAGARQPADDAERDGEPTIPAAADL